MRNARYNDLNSADQYKARELKHIIRKKSSRPEINQTYYYKKKLQKLTYWFGREEAENILRKELALKTSVDKTFQLKEGRVHMYDIICSENRNHIMVYNQEGKAGAGFYCTKCEAVELDSQVLNDPEFMDDQLKRRIIK